MAQKVLKWFSLILRSFKLQFGSIVLTWFGTFPLHMTAYYFLPQPQVWNVTSNAPFQKFVDKKVQLKNDVAYIQNRSE